MPLPKPGDVILTESHPGWFNFLGRLARWGIQRHQKKLGLKGWRFTHCMMFFDENQTFSVTYPKAKWEKWGHIKGQDYAIFRMKGVEFVGRYMGVMYASAGQMVGTRYDIRQLLDIAINRILGYPRGHWLRIFDAGLARNVCSVGVRTLHEALRKWSKEKFGHELFPRLFTIDGEKLHVERTAPAHYSNEREVFECIWTKNAIDEKGDGDV